MKLTGYSELGRSPAFISQEGNLTSIFHLTLSDDHGMLLARARDGYSITGFHFFFIFQPSDVLAFIVQLHAEDGCIIYEDRSLSWKFFNDVPFKLESNYDQQTADSKVSGNTGPSRLQQD